MCIKAKGKEHIKYHSLTMKFFNKSILLLCCCVALTGAHPFFDASVMEAPDAKLAPLNCKMGNGQSATCTPSFQSCLAGQDINNLRHCNLMNDQGHLTIGACCVTAKAETSIQHLVGPFFPSIATSRPSTTTPNHQPVSCDGTPAETTTFRPVTEAVIAAAGSQAGVVCGVGPKNATLTFDESKIVGGKPAVPHSWPFQVALNFRGKFSCGGSLLDAYNILTAAHCIINVIDNNELEVVLGMHTLKDKDVVRRKVRRVTPHKKYDLTAKNHAYDIAILRMDKAVTFTKKISPVCLPAPADSGNLFVGVDAVVMGWGDTTQDGENSNVLKQATLKVVSNERCNDVYGNSEDADPIDMPIERHMMCAISPGEDTCQNDSGGPLVIKTASGAWVQAGIVSWGRGCAKPEIPGVYTRVTSFSKWIAENSRQ